MSFKLAKKTPAKSAPTKKKATAKKAAPRRVEDDEATEAGGPKMTVARKGVVTAGWGGAKEMSTGGDFIQTLDFKNHANNDGGTRWFILKFLEDAPYANVKLHWLDRKGKRSFVCVGDDCPLCEVGSDTKPEFRFNVAVFTEEAPVLRSWAAGWKIYRKIESLAQSKLTSPLPKRIYFATRIGEKFNEIEYGIARINEDEIAETYPDIHVPTDEEIAELVPYTLEDVSKEYSTIEELEEMAAEIVEGE